MAFRDIQRLAYLEVAAPILQRAIQSPDATLGWAGDPDLVIAWNKLQNRWEVWREEPWFDYTDQKWHTVHREILAAPAGERLDPAQLIRKLVERDTLIEGNSHVDAMERHLKNLEAEEAERERRDYERLRPTHEKLAWTLAKENDGVQKFVSLTGTVKENHVDAG